MFTGLIEAKGKVLYRLPGPPMRLGIAMPVSWTSSVEDGASIACDGVCLTVVQLKVEDESLVADFDVGPTTIERTNLGSRIPGSYVNLERSLTADRAIGGHLVSGHVDAVTKIIAMYEEDGCRQVRIATPNELIPFICPKGSVTLDGTSLTVAEIDENNLEWFRVMLIPATLEATTWGDHKPSDMVNVEIDQIARYVVHAAQNLVAVQTKNTSSNQIAK